jgi:hypothetical protein
MDAGHLFGSLAWPGICVGYALTVRKLARMARAAAPADVDQHDSKLRIVIDAPIVPRGMQPGSATARGEAADVSARGEAYRRA